MEVLQQEWVCIPGPVSWSGLGVCDSPQCPRSRVIRSWGRRDPTAEGSGVRRQLVGFPRWVPWRVSPWWKSQGEPGAKQTLGGGTRDRQGAVLLAGLIRRRPGGPWGLLPQHFPPASPQAAILQQTAEYIFSLEQEKTRLLQQNTQLKRFIQEFSGSSPKRRRAEDKDEGIGSPDIWEDEKAEDLRREMIELRQQLDKERSVRMMLEEQVRSLEAHMYPEKLKVIAQQVQLQQQQEQVRLLHQEKLEREQQIRTQVSAPQTPPGTGTRGVGSVMDSAPPVATDVPAKLSLLIWERGGSKPPTVLGAVLAGILSSREGLWIGPPVVASQWLCSLHRGVCTGEVTYCQRGFHLPGFTFLWVTPTEFQGSPNHSLPPSRLGKGECQAGR
uniref:Transcription factor AP-4 n=2 Tax=Passeriformes TaxID=9126 RepID=A0A674H8R7_TAEGU